MLKNSLGFLVCFAFIQLNAQNNIDTIYTNEKNEIVSKNQATYYKVIQAQKDGLFPFFKYSSLNNKLYASGYYSSLSNYILEGKFTYYNENTGKVESTYNYINDTLNGEKTMYDSTGKIKYIEQYKNNILNGDCKYFYTNGNIRRLENYKDGNLTFGKCYKLNGEDTLYFPRNTKPKFRNGTFQDFVNENFNNDSKIKYETGLVEIRFMLNEDGSVVKNSLIITKGSELIILANEAIRLVKIQPNYIPAYEDGQPVKVRVSVKVAYQNDTKPSNPRKELRKQKRGR